MNKPRPLQIALGVGAGVALAGGGYAVAASTNHQIHACVNTKTHVLMLEAKCPRGTRGVVWSVRGPAGPAGVTGKNGVNGTNGTSVSLNPTVNVTEVSPSAPAAASISQGSGGQDTLNLSIPQGATGAAGASTGPNAYGEVWVGSSSAQLAPGSGAGVQTVTGGTGSAFVKVTNCAAATPTEPIITVTPNKDSADSLSGSNNNTTGEPTVYVNSFGNDNFPGDHVLTFTVLLTSTTGASITTDFSFAVSC
jgi:hypothetical protein